MQCHLPTDRSPYSIFQTHGLIHEKGALLRMEEDHTITIHNPCESEQARVGRLFPVGPANTYRITINGSGKGVVQVRDPKGKRYLVLDTEDGSSSFQINLNQEGEQTVFTFITTEYMRLLKLEIRFAEISKDCVLSVKNIHIQKV
jgi:hypothetical protein